MKRGALIVLAILLLIGPLYFRACTDAAFNLSQARAYRAEKEFNKAIEYYRRSVSWRAPFVSDSFIAATELKQMAALNLSDTTQRIRALRELRSGYLGSRSFLDQLGLIYPAESDWEALMTSVEQELTSMLTANTEKQDYLIIGSDYQENSLIQILVQVSFWGWVVTVMKIIWESFSMKGVIDQSRKTIRIVVASLFFVLWLISLKLA